VLRAARPGRRHPGVARSTRGTDVLNQIVDDSSTPRKDNETGVEFWTLWTTGFEIVPVRPSTTWSVHSRITVGGPLARCARGRRREMMSRLAAVGIDMDDVGVHRRRPRRREPPPVVPGRAGQARHQARATRDSGTRWTGLGGRCSGCWRLRSSAIMIAAQLMNNSSIHASSASTKASFAHVEVVWGGRGS
jgi:hypothetical protein